MSIRLSMMVAKASNDVIGRDNKLPWYLPNDLKYFKQVTFGKPVIMGRKTWESLKGPLPGRTNIVITRQADYVAEGAKVVTTLEEAVAMAENVAFIDGQEEAVIMGGAEIYKLALPAADRLYLTEVHAEVHMLTGVSYNKIDQQGLHIVMDDEEKLLEVDTIILCAGQESDRKLFDQLQELNNVHLIGGAEKAMEIDAKRAIDQGCRLAAEI